MRHPACTCERPIDSCPIHRYPLPTERVSAKIYGIDAANQWDTWKVRDIIHRLEHIRDAAQDSINYLEQRNPVMGMTWTTRTIQACDALDTLFPD